MDDDVMKNAFLAVCLFGLVLEGSVHAADRYLPHLDSSARFRHGFWIWIRSVIQIQGVCVLKQSTGVEK